MRILDILLANFITSLAMITSHIMLAPTHHGC